MPNENEPLQCRTLEDLAKLKDVKDLGDWTASGLAALAARIDGIRAGMPGFILPRGTASPRLTTTPTPTPSGGQHFNDPLTPDAFAGPAGAGTFYAAHDLWVAIDTLAARPAAYPLTITRLTLTIDANASGVPTTYTILTRACPPAAFAPAAGIAPIVVPPGGTGCFTVDGAEPVVAGGAYVVQQMGGGGVRGSIVVGGIPT